MPRRFAVAVSLAVFLLAPLHWPRQARAADHQAPPAGTAASYPAVETHSREGVAIAADPYNTKSKIALFRLDYLQYRFMPIRIIVTNNSDHPISLADAHIDFISAAQDKIPAADARDVDRRAEKIKSLNSGYKLPFPLPRVGNKPGKQSKEIEEDFHEFGFSTNTVAPHTTSAGFLFYDISQLANPLVGAHVSLTVVRDATGKELFPFDIPLDRYLAQAASHRKR